MSQSSRAAQAARDAEPTDPGQAGPLEVAILNRSLGTTDGQAIPLTVYLPRASGPFPVVVFEHGYKLDPALYQSYGRHLASWGIAVVMPKMPGGLVFGPTHRQLAQYLGSVIDWTLGSAPGAEWPGKLLDPERLALVGHSLGGKIAMLRATMDARPRAVFGIDPVDAAGPGFMSPSQDYPSVTPELMGRVHVPFVAMGETTNATCTGFHCQPCAPAADNFQQYFAHAAGPALLVDVLGASHMSFLDDPDCGLVCKLCPAGPADAATTRMLARRTLTAFLEVVLNRDARYLSWLTGRDAEQEAASGLIRYASTGNFLPGP